MMRAWLCVLLFVAPSALMAAAASPELTADIGAVQESIRLAEAEDERLAGGLVKAIVSLRLATLRQSLAMLEQRARAASSDTQLHYTVDGSSFASPADAGVQIAEVEAELTTLRARIAAQKQEVSRYSGGLVLATSMATLATMKQTEAMLDQKRLALKYALPQYVGFRDSVSGANQSAAGSANLSPQAATAASPATMGTTESNPLPADCLKIVFGSFCLGAPVGTLPPNPSSKTDERYFYTEPDTTVVELVDGRIAVVGRLYQPGTWLTYRRLEADLIEKYGPGKDLSFFPDYADDASSKETAISLKKAAAVRSWHQAGFSIQLKWQSSDSVGLIYYHDQLEQVRSSRKKDQY